MGTILLVLVVVLVVAALIFGVVSLLSGDDPGLANVEPDGRAVPLPNNRSLTEDDIKTIRFDVTWRGYRMAQIDRLLRRTAYDIGYKNEMIAVLEAEVIALREGREEDAELLRKARESAASTNPTQAQLVVSPALSEGLEENIDDVPDTEVDSPAGFVVADGGAVDAAALAESDPAALAQTGPEALAQTGPEALAETGTEAESVPSESHSGRA
jgi:DivIVA domain-containing protein